MEQLKLYRLNTGSCGGCDSELVLAVGDTPELSWAASPYEADALVLTGPMTLGMRGPLLQLLSQVPDTPLLAIGRCALDGHPFGKGGVQALPDVAERVALELDGCPPTPEAMARAILAHLSPREPPPASTDATDQPDEHDEPAAASGDTPQA